MSEEEIRQGNQFGGGNEMRVECQQTEGVRRRVPSSPHSPREWGISLLGNYKRNA